MVDVTTSVVISCPMDKVVEYASDPDNAPSWYVNIKSVAWKTPKPLAVGSAVAFVANFLGKKLAYTYEVTELSGNRLVMQTVEGPFPMETIYQWEAINKEATRMVLQNRGNPTGFSKLFSPFMAFMMRRANQKDLMCLKKILERTG
jgi:uncharacterized membrane protein